MNIHREHISQLQAQGLPIPNDAHTEPCEECGAAMTYVNDGWVHADTPTSHECYTAYRWGVK
jgi:hypothetical protein